MHINDIGITPSLSIDVLNIYDISDLSFLFYPPSFQKSGIHCKEQISSRNKQLNKTCWKLDLFFQSSVGGLTVFSAMQTHPPTKNTHTVILRLKVKLFWGFSFEFSMISYWLGSFQILSIDPEKYSPLPKKPWRFVSLIRCGLRSLKLSTKPPSLLGGVNGTFGFKLGMRLDWFLAGEWTNKFWLHWEQQLTEENESSLNQMIHIFQVKKTFPPSLGSLDPSHPHPRHMRKWSSVVPLFLFKLKIPLEKIHSLKLRHFRPWK